jgi:hypothetical protein
MANGNLKGVCGTIYRWMLFEKHSAKPGFLNPLSLAVMIIAFHKKKWQNHLPVIFKVAIANHSAKIL